MRLVDESDPQLKSSTHSVASLPFFTSPVTQHFSLDSPKTTCKSKSKSKSNSSYLPFHNFISLFSLMPPNPNNNTIPLIHNLYLPPWAPLPQLQNAPAISPAGLRRKWRQCRRIWAEKGKGSGGGEPESMSETLPEIIAVGNRFSSSCC